MKVEGEQTKKINSNAERYGSKVFLKATKRAKDLQIIGGSFA